MAHVWLQPGGESSPLPAVSTAVSGSPAPSFHLFSYLPAELRLKVWRFSFEPRAVEIHARRSHYADDFQHGGMPKWQSGCTNPAALATSSEARAAAQRHYTVRFPLATVAACERAGDSVTDLYRVLYLNLATDVLVILGDMDFRRMSRLPPEFRRLDPTGEGLKRMAVSASWTYHPGAAASVRMFVRNLIPELRELIVFMYAEMVPPAHWSSGSCSLDDCDGTDYYKRHVVGMGQRTRDGYKWLVTGGRDLKVSLKELNFRHGW
ncbi:hypothetical protein NKR23_g3435 [Pleurostoma richardsiae]|uniref:2EXR domain-containing protein n=1 Tax=Pleurostoma richardsiae TaxID=41990 RepID=A0AA38VH38_9PEZI|nr:hypothetical protein NKR23_g3435 [Pleurostoma richardsiae]